MASPRRRRTSPLRQAIAETMADLRERVEVSWHHDRWHVTASSFASALEYVEARFGDAVVLARRDHGRRWPRVTLEVSTDPALAAEAPPLSELVRPPAPEAPPPVVPKPRREAGEPDPAGSEMPAALEAIFARQNGARRQ